MHFPLKDQADCIWHNPTINPSCHIAKNERTRKIYEGLTLLKRGKIRMERSDKATNDVCGNLGSQIVRK